MKHQQPNEVELALGTSSATLMEKAFKNGGEIAWSRSDVPEVIRAADESGLAIIGGQVAYWLPDATCDCYWLAIDSRKREERENWKEYCSRAAAECLSKFNVMVTTKDIESEAVESFPVLASKRAAGIWLEPFLRFVLHFSSEG